MKKYVVVSTDNNKEYANLLPLTCYSWIKLGYTPIIIEVPQIKGEDYELPTTGMGAYLGNTIIQPITGISGMKDGTVAQVSRLFICSINSGYISDDDIIVTSDADMVIAKDIFVEDAPIVSYGHDLTGFGDYPICYVKATKGKWLELMQTEENSIQTEIENAVSQNAYSDDWNLYWDEDQKLLTKRIQQYGVDKILSVNRGHDQSNHGLPLGRWDRYKWENIPSEIIDVHMKRNDLDAQVKVFETLFPNDDISWLLEFHKSIKTS